MKTYYEVADQHKLDETTKKRFLAYMRIRWGDPEDEAIKCQVGYASEWAERFKSGSEFLCSDNEGQRVLREIDRAK